MTRSAAVAPGTTASRFRDIHWIRGAVQTAIAIEHATMPLYAAAMYSIEVQNYPAYNTLRSVLMEEMLHMAAMCNVLAGIGGAPRIRELDPTLILDGLPAGIAPELRPRLAALSRRQLDTFMRIEAPVELLSDEQNRSRYPTIDSFYEQIKEAVKTNAAAVAAAAGGRLIANQVGGNLGYAVINPKADDPVEQILASLDLITHQGSGFGRTTLTSGARSQNELSHYARFAELRYGRTFTGVDAAAEAAPIRREGQRRYFQGKAIAWPTVVNTLAVPRDGYAAILRIDPDMVDVLRELRTFDQTYTRMLAALDDSWNGPAEQSWPALGRAVLEMNDLRVVSCFNILRKPVPSAALERLDDLYPAEAKELRGFSNLDAPLFYGPRFFNTSLAGRAR